MYDMYGEDLTNELENIQLRAGYVASTTWLKECQTRD